MPPEARTCDLHRAGRVDRVRIAYILRQTGRNSIARSPRRFNIPRFIDSPKNRLPWGDFWIRHGAFRLELRKGRRGLAAGRRHDPPVARLVHRGRLPGADEFPRLGWPPADGAG